MEGTVAPMHGIADLADCLAAAQYLRGMALTDARVDLRRGVGVAGAIGGCLVAFIAVQTLLNQLVGWWFGLIGLPYMDLAYFLGRLAWPVAFLMGIATSDCESVGRLVIS